MRTYVRGREVRPDEQPSPSITTVLETIASYLGGQPTTTNVTLPGPTRRTTNGLSGSEELMATVTETLFADGTLRFDDDVVRTNLDELLLLLIAQRRQETNGKALIEDLTQLFDADLSPGTVYPRLHHLKDEGVLDVQELVRTKEYAIDDDEAARRRLERSLSQHLALSYAIHLTLEDL